MKTLRKSAATHAGGGRVGVGPRLAMLGLALVGLIGFEGCQTGGCGSCGGAGGLGQRMSGFGQRVGQGVSRVFHPRRWSTPASECCDGGGMVIDGGATTVVPGPIIQSPGATETISPELAPATPSSGTGSKPAAGAKDQGSLKSSPSSNVRMSYETARPVIDGPSADSDRTNVAGRLLPRGATSAPAPTASTGGGRHPLDDIPPVDLSKDVTLKATSAPVPVEAEKISPPTSARVEPKPADAGKSADANPGATAAEPPTASVSLPSLGAALETSMSPGISRFTGVEPNLAGGSLPSREGLEWLKEKGYHTFVDLRDSKDIAKSYVDEVNKLGLRHVALPFAATTIDPKSVKQFGEEIGKADARPIYFCDNDGSRAALLWYVYRVSEAGIDNASALRESREIAPLTDATLKTADAYIKSRPASVMKAKSSRLINGSAVMRFTGMEKQLAIPDPKSINAPERRIREGSASLLGTEPSKAPVLPWSGE